MTQRNETGIATFTAGEALEPYRRVKLDGANEKQVVYADAGEQAIGVTVDRSAITEKAAVHLFNRPGTFEIESAGAVTVNANVYGAADGKVDDTAAGLYLGKALKASAGTGEVIEILATKEEAAQAANVVAAAAVTAGAPAVTYAAPVAGATVDTEGRASLAQAAADLVAVRAELAKAVTDLGVLRTAINAEIAAIKAAGLQATA